MPDEVVYPPSSADATGMSTPGAARSTIRRLAREDRDLAGRVSGGDGEHVGQDSGVAEWVAEVARVPGRRHDEGPEADGLTHRGLDRRVLGLRAEAQVDHGSPSPGGGENALHDLARIEPHSVPDRRVVRADHSLGIDADDTDAVHRSPHHGSDGRSVDAADGGRLLGVQRHEVRPPGELRMPEEHPRVDERDRHPGARRRQPGDADGSTPPLVRHERIGKVRSSGTHRVHSLLLGEPERVARAKRWDDSGSTAGRQAPHAQLHVHGPGAGAGKELPLDQVRLVVQLDERRRRGGCPGAVHVGGESDERRHACERQCSGQKEAGRPARPVHTLQ